MGGNRYIPAFRVDKLRLLVLGRGLLRGASLCKAPLNSASFLPFLPKQERQPPEAVSLFYKESKLITFDTSIIFIIKSKKEGAANRSFSYYI